MVLTISTNTTAINVQRNLNKANTASASSLAKLSSGSRVPTAKDDAASLAIGSRVEAEIAGLKQASTNASQATSLLQIADGAMGEINNILVRQSTLAIQSSSGQLSDTERAIINSEFTELTSEVNRIADDTEFNGNQVLNGGDLIASTNEFAKGGLANKGLEISYDTSNVTDGNNFVVEYNGTSETLKLTNTTTGEIIEKDITDALTAKTGGAGTDLGAGETLDVEFKDAGVKITLNEDFTRATGFGISSEVTGPTTALNLGDEATAIKLETGADFSAITGSADFDAASGKLTLHDSALGALTADGLTIAVGGVDDAVVSAGALVEIKDGANVLASFTLGTTNFNIGALNESLEIDLSTAFSYGETAGTAANYDFKVGTGTGAEDEINVSINSVTAAALGTGTSSVATQADADNAITAVKSAIDTLQGSRASIGASLSRLDFASSNISVAIENQSAAKSGLLDVDVAEETTNFAAQQVVVQAGVSLLAQANQQPQQLLKLIG